ncbi:MAG TPA: hypothetical protein VK737_06120 [Opitutales bacterium]|jgi:hypothetical protein|nr:hypothetical protein [Opitutales bacterium]
MLHPWLFVGFTGHRKVDDVAGSASAIRAALEKVRTLGGRPLAAVSSAATGGDTLFIEAARSQNLPWTAMLPFPREDFRKDFSAVEWAHAEKLLDDAVQEKIEPPGAPRNQAFLACGVRTVESCDVLIALWNGEAAAGVGGTADIVAYARAQQKPLIWINSQSGLVTEERLDKIVALSPPATSQPVVDDSPDGGLALLRETLAYHDQLAMQHAPKARGFLTRAVVLQLVATAFGLVSPVFHVIFAVVIVLLFIKVIILFRADYIQRRHSGHHDQWLHARMVAELCRSALATWHMPYPEFAQQPLPVPHYDDWQRSLRLWRILAPPRPRDLATDQQDYLQNRIQHQLNHFESKGNEARDILLQKRRWAKFCTRAALACGIFGLVEAVLNKWVWSENNLPTWFPHLNMGVTFLSLILPVISAGILHLVIAQDYSRRVSRNQRMVAYLHWAQARIPLAASPADLRLAAGEVESMLLLEFFEWYTSTNLAKELRP